MQAILRTSGLFSPTRRSGRSRGRRFDRQQTIRTLEDPALAAVPIIAMTANAFREDVRAAEEAGMQAHIAKPIDVNLLMQTLQQVLKRPPEGRKKKWKRAATSSTPPTGNERSSLPMMR